MAVPDIIKNLARKVRKEIYGKDVRESIAESMEVTGETADDAHKRSVEQLNRVDRLIRDNPQPSEIVDARGDYPILLDRLNASDSQLTQTEQDLNDRGLNGKQYGLSGVEEIDDTEAFVDLLDNRQGNVIFLPNDGVYNLKSWAKKIIDQPLTIIGLPGDKKPILKGLPDVDLFEVTARLTFINVAFDNWNVLFDFNNLNTTISQFKLENCDFTNIRNVARSHPSNDLAKITTIKVANCDIEESSNVAFGFTCKIDRAIFKENIFENITIRAISIGKNATSIDDVLENQDKWSNIIITDNKFKNIHRNDVGELQAIIVYGWRVKISGNDIENIENFADQTGKNLEGIYIKCRYAQIEGNELINASGEQGGINIKGQVRGLFDDPSFSPESFGNVVRDNKVISDKPYASGIHLQTGDILITGNYIEGMGYRGIWSNSHEGNNVKVVYNTIIETQGNRAIYLRCAGTSVDVSHNTIENVKGNTGEGRSVGIQIDLPSTFDPSNYKNYRIINNTINSIRSDNNNNTAININSNGGNNYRDVIIAMNSISNVNRGIFIDALALDALIRDNSFDVVSEKVVTQPNFTDARVIDNRGYKTKSQGNAILVNNTRRVTVNHGLDIKPPNYGIQVTPRYDVNGLYFWVPDGSINSNTFDIVMSDDTPTSIAFSWSVNAEIVN